MERVTIATIATLVLIAVACLTWQACTAVTTTAGEEHPAFVEKARSTINGVTVIAVRHRSGHCFVMVDGGMGMAAAAVSITEANLAVCQ